MSIYNSLSRDVLRTLDPSVYERKAERMEAGKNSRVSNFSVEKYEALKAMSYLIRAAKASRGVRKPKPVVNEFLPPFK